MSLWFEGRAEVLSEYDEKISSPSLTIRLPAVVRLRRNTPTKNRTIRFTRHSVALRDSYTCQYCSKKLTMAHLTYDHVVPKSRGGRTSWNNIVVCCHPCNSAKGSHLPEEAGMPLLKKPKAPKWLPVTGFVLSSLDTPPEWGPWLS